MMKELGKLHFIKVNMKKLVTPRNIAIVTAIVFVVCLIPIIGVAGYDRASGDDFGYGARARQAFLASHALIPVIKAACAEVANFYKYWQGTWFSIFLFCFQPEVFSPNAYWIVPYAMLLLLFVGVSCFLKGVLVDGLQIEKSIYWIVDLGVLFALIQYVPYKTSGIFWYNGAVHYIVPLFLALTSLGLLFQFICGTRKMGAYIGANLLMILLSGMSYLSAFLAPLLIILMMVLFWPSKRRKMWCLVFPIIAEMPGLIISALAPGNAARGGEQYEVSLSRGLYAIVMSFRDGILQLPNLVKENLIVVGIFVLLIPVIWYGLRNVDCKYEFSFPMPGFILFYLFGVYCAMYWPGIFAGTEVSGGVPNTIFQVWVICIVLGEIYLIGWIQRKGIKRLVLPERYDRMVFIDCIVFACLIMLSGMGQVKKSTAYICYAYLASGQADDYKKQMDEITDIMLGDEMEVIIPPVNDKQGPLMHMPATEESDNFTNEAYARFYGKKSVRADFGGLNN